LIPDATDLVADLEAWCASYVVAFEAFDVTAIGAHWAFPTMIVSGDRQLIMQDKASFDRNTDALVDFYKRHNARNVKRRVIAAYPMVDMTAAMQVEDVISEPDGQPITQWVSAYVLRRTPEGWRAIFADASGEAAAWAARGTPLGSK